MRKQILEDQSEMEQRQVNLGKNGEAKHSKDLIPMRKDLRKVCLSTEFQLIMFSPILQEVDELMDSVHGAMKARLQLGFDQVADQEWNLKPVIKDLGLRLGSHTAPLINRQVGPVHSNKAESSSHTRVPVGAKGFGKSPNH